LGQIDKTGFEDLLRKLTADDDVEIRRRALTVLNDRLASSASIQPPAGDRFCRVEPGARENIAVESVSFADDMLIVAYRNWVRAFDTKTHRERWNRRSREEVGEIVLAAGQQVVLASRYGALLALDMQGRVRWSRAADSQQWTDETANELTHLFWWKNEIIVVRWHTVEHLDPTNGATKATYPATGYIGGADATDTSLCFVDGSGLHCLDGGHREFLNGRGVSATSDRICTASGDGGDYNLLCLSGGTLSELWTRSFRYDIGTPVQDGSRVVVETYEGLTALRSVDGSILWTVAEEVNSYHVPTAYGLLTRDGMGRPELRDPQTGELRRFWPQVYGTKVAVQGKWAAIADFDVVWLLDLSAQANAR
jgi:outer membrane protein assembly factor BamB